jgi:hypothetical protein
VTRTRIDRPATVLLRRAFESGLTFDWFQAATYTGMSVKSGREYLRVLHAAHEIHILRWRFSGRGPRYPVFAWGEDDDVPKPDLVKERARRRHARWVVQGAPLRVMLGSKR